MEIVLALIAGGAAVAGGRWLWDRRARRAEDATELAGVKALADEDVTLLGEELHRLDVELGRLGAEGRADYQKALDAFESAERLVRDLQSVDQISRVTDTLATGRFALACVRSRLNDEPLPELRVPCFFNPQHGPSVRDVVFTPRRRGTRTVPACAQDAARVQAGEQPEVRMITIGARKVPYWEGGLAYMPYGAGYFVSGALAGGEVLAWAFVPASTNRLGPGHSPGENAFGADNADHGYGHEAGSWDGMPGH